MRKLMFGMFLLAGTTFGFANTTNSSITNKTSLEKFTNVKGLTIVSVIYDDAGKCTVKATYSTNGGKSTGTITVTAETCQKAAQAIAVIFGTVGM